MTDITVVGSFVQDLAFSTETFPAPGETRIGTFRTGPGGKGFNQAIAAHRQGVSTQFIGAVGRDIFAQAVREFIASEGIEADLLEIENQSTGGASIVVDAKAQNLIVVALGANGFLTGKHVEATLRASKVVLVQAESNLSAAHAALTVGRKRGCLTIFNPAPINPDVSQELLSLADVLTPNETEFTFLLEHLHGLKVPGDVAVMGDAELGALCGKLSTNPVVVTLGERGCFICEGQKRCTRVDPIRAQVRDTTGAGDAFSGGLAAGLVTFNRNLVQAAKFATVVAGLSTEGFGTAPSMPPAQQVQERFAKEFGR